MRTVIPRNAKLVPPEAKRVFKGIIYDVYHWQQKRFDGSEATFEMLKRADTVKVIPIKDGKILAINDEQPGYPPKLTLPGGRHDIESETELDCAKRELREELGLTFKNWRLIYADQLHQKIDHVLYIFLATDLEKEEPPTPDTGGEKIELREVTFEGAKQIAEKGADKYWPSELLRKVHSLDELLSLPEYK